MDEVLSDDTKMSTDNSCGNEGEGARSLSPAEVGVKRVTTIEDSFDYPDDEAAQKKIISEAVKEEDEFLEYIMALGNDIEKKEATKKQPPLMRSTSEKSSPKVGLDHLDNLCKLMEQLGDLRQQNSKLQRRVHYLEDLKNLQEMHKHLQEDSINHREDQETELLKSLQRHRDLQFVAESPRRSKKLCRHRQSLQPSPQQRERSQSVGIDELNDLQETYELTNKKSKRRQRRSIAEFPTTSKAKVSKWTKVKEAFRWEKASVVILPETKSQDSGLGGISHHCCEEKGRYLRVPVGDLLSGSPSADSVISGHSLCSSGGPSGEYTLPPITAMSSSSSSEELDIDFNYSDILSEFGPQRSSSAADTSGRRLLGDEKRRSSLTRTPEEDEQKSRSKSLDGDDAINSLIIAGHFNGKDSEKSSSQQKSHKTPWGKVKDIIQTRKDSLKQRHRGGVHGDGGKTRSRRGSSKSRAREAPASSDHDEELSVFDVVDTASATTPEGASPPCDSSMDGIKVSTPRPRIEITRDLSRRQKVPKATLGNYPEAALTNRRLTPMLTITLPSTEELRQLSSSQNLGKFSTKPPPSPQTEERLKLSPTSTHPCNESVGGKNDGKQTGLISPTASAGTSPPVHRRSSKWTKVKKAFLTSSGPGHRDAEASGQLSCSVPSSPNRASNFFYETDTEELSGGEQAGDDDEPHRGSNGDPRTIQAEIQRNYEELQQKLSQEFHKKIHEWEKIKSASSTTASGVGRASSSAGCGGEDNYQCPDKGFRRKMEEWERIKNKDSTSSGKRESMAGHPLDVDNLSPHFRKKLNEWQRKKGIHRDDSHHQSRRKIVEWQLWRTGSGKQGCGSEDQDDFHRKQREWERMKSTSPGDSPTRKDAGLESERNSTGARTPSPGVVRKNSTGNAKKKAAPVGAGAKTSAKPAKMQKEKELHWLEKELQKIEREKQRLEREREKYLEREKRLEKLRRAVGSHPGKQEVLIQTSTGFFRFQGISEKFTRRLYEWEKARGIAPEASTFALLDPGYKPCAGDEEIADGGMLTWSKSASSVTNLSGGCGTVSAMTHQPSSLSLNDVESLEQPILPEARASSDPQIHTGSEPRAAVEADADADADDQEDDEPAAVIVDIEDVVEETAALLVATPAVESQTPIYCYAPEEVTRLIDSSGSESERDGTGAVRRTDSVRTESSYKLIEENIHLLGKLQIKGEICRKLESELEELEEKIEHVTRSHEMELQRLRQEEQDIHDLNAARAAVRLEDSAEDSGAQAALIDALRARIQELEGRQERLRREGVTLQDSFVEHSEQQAAIAQNLVGKMKQLQQVNSNMASMDQDQHQLLTRLNSRQECTVALVQGLSTQLLTLAEKLELALGERNREVLSLRSELEERRRGGGALRLSRGLSADAGLSLSMGSLTSQDIKSSQREITGPYIPRQSSVELSQLPSLLTHKVLELKQGLNYLCAATEPADGGATLEAVVQAPPSTDYRRLAVAMPAVSTHLEEPPSPVPEVTVTPGFLRRQKKVKEISPEGDKQIPLNVHPTVEVRESFCSTVSSSNSTSSGDGDKLLTKNLTDNDAKEKKKRNLKINATVRGLNFESTSAQDAEESAEVVKTRRASDSYIAYKSEKIGTITKLEPEREAVNKRSTENVSKIPIRVRDNVGEMKQNREEPASEGASAMPVNVFVPTTRKIFSPVRRDSKGKASSVIGYVVTEEPEVQDDTVATSSTATAAIAAVVETTAVRPTIMATTPSWMIMRSRSQSASPALPRRRLHEGNGFEQSSHGSRLPRFSPDKTEGGLLRKPHEGSLEMIKEAGIKSTENGKITQLENASQVVIKTDAVPDKRDLEVNGSRATTPLGFPPLPPSPSPGRRDLYKQIAKDTAPSIRMMIAKYNQKLTEQDGGRSPEVGGSGSASPVAWRSPVAERRVRTQMARYQEEVQRVLQQGSRYVGRPGYGEVQKSASAGVIRAPEPAAAKSNTKNDNSEETVGTPSLVRRGILKSSSAGSIKPASSVPASPEPKLIQTHIVPIKAEVKPPPSSDVAEGHVSLSSTISESPRLSRRPEPLAAPGSPPLPRLRALRLQQAKEEFLTRGPGGRSWDMTATSTSSASASTSSEPIWVKQVTEPGSNEAGNRLSHISVGSESSCSSQVFHLASPGEDDGSALMKSASAGMINVDTDTYQKFSTPIASDSLPRNMKDKSSKFGISSITSKFRRVKMRKSKVKDDEGKAKMNTVSLLCRQSLLVDINRRGNNGSDCPPPSTSKSCPSSPVLQRTSSTETALEDESSSHSSTSWVKNSAKKIFKPK